MSSSSSSSSAAAAAAAPAPKVEQAFREAKLRVGFDKVLQAWRGRADASGGLKDAFPNLYPKYGKQLDALYNTLWQEMHQFMKDEMDCMLRDSNVSERLRLLESLMQVAEGKALPPPAEVMPEDEIRAAEVEAKLGYAKQLEALLKSLSAENVKLEAEVEIVNARARKVVATFNEESALYGQLVAACGPFLPGSEQQIEQLDEDDAAASSSSSAAGDATSSGVAR